ncbi:MAG: hypothetical protein AAB486_02825 [Patescibacteria group bacterium]
MTDKQHNLIGIINERINSMVGDCNTFLLAKQEVNNFDKTESVGGGNFLGALGALSAILFLARLYCKLIKSEEHGDGMFLKLVRDFPDHLGLCGSDKDIKDLWRNYRVALAHMISPKRPVAAFTKWEGHTFEEYLTKINSSTTSAFQIDIPEKGSTFIEFEFLVRDVTRITNWLTDKISNGDFDEQTVLNVLNWAKSKCS